MKHGGTLWYSFICWLVRECFFRPMGGMKVLGSANVPLEGPLIVTPVHVSFLDPPVLGGVCPRALRFMAKEELFRGPLGALISSVGAFPVKRGTSDSAAVRLALAELAKGNAIIMFPEGQRGDGVTMGQIQTGVGMLAKRSGAWVVPVGIAGTNIMWPRGSKRIRRSRVTVIFGEPFRYSDIQGTDERDTRKQFVAELSSRIWSLTKQAGLELKPAAHPTQEADA